MRSKIGFEAVVFNALFAFSDPWRVIRSGNKHIIRYLICDYNDDLEEGLYFGYHLPAIGQDSSGSKVHDRIVEVIRTAQESDRARFRQEGDRSLFHTLVDLLNQHGYGLRMSQEIEEEVMGWLYRPQTVRDFLELMGVDDIHVHIPVSSLARKGH